MYIKMRTYLKQRTLYILAGFTLVTCIVFLTETSDSPVQHFDNNSADFQERLIPTVSSGHPRLAITASANFQKQMVPTASADFQKRLVPAVPSGHKQFFSTASIGLQQRSAALPKQASAKASIGPQQWPVDPPKRFFPIASGLPQRSISSEHHTGFNDGTNNPMPEILTLHCNEGRLGNQMCTLAVLQGLGTLNKRNISILPCNKKMLDPYFELTVPEVNTSTFVEHEPYDIGYYLHPEDKKILNTTNIIKGVFHPCSFTFYNHIREDIRETFHFREEFRSNAEKTLLYIKGNRINVTFVGVHVRRGDYIKRIQSGWLWAFDGREVDMEYFEKATKYFMEKYPNVIFVLVSDDLAWCRQNLKNFSMYIPQESLGPAYDMALLAHCNHTLMTYGTFGFWGAYLAGGDVVYFDKFLKPDTDFTRTVFQFKKMYLPEWIGIDTTKPRFWDTYVRPPLQETAENEQKKHFHSHNLTYEDNTNM